MNKPNLSPKEVTWLCRVFFLASLQYLLSLFPLSMHETSDLTRIEGNTRISVKCRLYGVHPTPCINYYAMFEIQNLMRQASVCLEVRRLQVLVVILFNLLFSRPVIKPCLAAFTCDSDTFVLNVASMNHKLFFCTFHLDSKNRGNVCPTWSFSLFFSVNPVLVAFREPRDYIS